MHQYLFFIGNFPIRSYGLVLITSILLATGVAYFLAKQDGRWHHHVLDIGLWGGLCGIIGARLWDVFFFDWSYYSHHLLEIPFVWQGGMAIQGGVLGGVIAGIVYTKIYNIDTWEFADKIAAPSIILGQALGRAANLLNGDAFGSPTGGNFGILYPQGTLAHAEYGNKPLWPAEIWESQIDMAIFAILLFYRTTKHGKGQVFTLYCLLYSAARFGLEYLRGDYAVSIGQLKSAQVTSLIVFLLALIIFIVLEIKRRRKKSVPA